MLSMQFSLMVSEVFLWFHRASLHGIWMKDSFISTQWLTKRALSPGQISQVALKTNETVLLHTGGKTTQWLITVLDDSGVVGEMASTALNSSYLVTRKLHAVICPSNKKSVDNSLSCEIDFKVLISLQIRLRKQLTASQYFSIIASCRN